MLDITPITSTGIIAIIRGDYVSHIEKLGEALYRGGVRVVEVTLNSPNALEMITRLSHAWRGRMCIGAGTVLTVAQIDDAVEAGAEFSVSPDTHAPVIERAIERGIEPFPGAYTPTEIRTAVRAGARFIKLFPAMPGGPAYLSQIRAPLNDVFFVPTGGIDQTNIPAFVKAGAVAFGIGSSLVPKTLNGSAAQWADIEESARRLVAVFTAAKNG